MPFSSLPEALPYCAKRVENYLATQLDSSTGCSPRLHQAMRYGLLQGGKRIRPFLVYACGEMLGAKPEQLDPAAAALEAIHTYSLLHDDLPAMDDDALRRGQPTCHIVFDEAEAILAGDALQTFAFELLSQPNPQLTAAQQLAQVSLLAKAAGRSGMCGGQSLDLQAEGQQLRLAELEQIHAAKTGALLEVAVQLAAVAADAPEAVKNALQRFAKAIGLAFQVQDDILDLISDTEVLGKPQGSDLVANKSTYPALLGLDGAKEKAAALQQEALQALNALPYNTDVLAALTRFIIERNN